MAAQTTVGIVAKVSHPDAAPLTRELLDWLAQRKLAALLDRYTATELRLDLAEELQAAREELSARCDIIVVLGGDGTLISVCRHPAERPPVIVGVNLGTLGFLTEITSSELFVALEHVLAGTAKLESRRLFDCEVFSNGDPGRRFSAINDVVITKQALARIFAIDVHIDGEKAAVVRGDGIIVATPAGSTAYSLAAGGSIVHPQVAALLITPICPHSLTSRPLILPASAHVELHLAKDTSDSEVYLTVDGQSGMALHSGDRVCVSAGRNEIRMATSPTKSYFEVLNAKLKWAAN